MKRLWRWLTYRRVLIVYDANCFARSTIASLGFVLPDMSIQAVILPVYGGASTPLSVFPLDELKSLQLKQLVAEIQKLSHPKPTVVDPKELL